jgi:hypothetical protein
MQRWLDDPRYGLSRAGSRASALRIRGNVPALGPRLIQSPGRRNCGSAGAAPSNLTSVFAWAVARRWWLLTENVKDFQPIKLRALQANASTAGLLFTSSRTFPRTRQHIGPLVDALDAWLAPIIEDWPQLI